MSKRVQQECSTTANIGGWNLHNFAFSTPYHPFEVPIVGMIWALASYADDYERRYKGKISDDDVIGTAWLDAVKAVKSLLNGETGPRLNCSRVDTLLTDLVRQAGFDLQKEWY